MSNPGTDVAVQGGQVERAAATVDPTGFEAEYLGLLRRMQRTVPTIVRMPGLNKSLIVSSGRGDNRQVDWDATRANVEVIGFTLADYGIPLNATNVQQWDLIQGSLQPRCQMLMGIVTALTGHAISLPVYEEDRAVAVLVRADTRERHSVTYTIDQAHTSRALDVWVERWNDSAKRYDKVVLGQSEPEALAAQKAHPVQWVQNAALKMNEAWHSHTADMLARRALKRVMRFGAPEVVSGSVGPRPHTPPAEVVAKATVERVDLGIADDGEDTPALAAGPEVASDPAPVELGDRSVPVQRRTIRLTRQLAAIPADVLSGPWAAAGLPPFDDDEFGPEHLDRAERVVDEITAAAMRPAEQVPTSTPSRAAGAGAVKASAGRGSEGSDPGGPADRSATPPGPSSDKARPLAQQIAMQAQAAGVDHHHVIAAVTDGRKTSARDVDTEEGQLTLQAIAAIAAGEYTVAQNGEGAWIFVDPPEVTYAPGEEPFE